MKQLLKNSEDYKYWLSGYNPQSYYINSRAEDEPISYPCIIVYNEQESYHVFKDAVEYEFVYLNDFGTVEDPERVLIQKSILCKLLSR